MTRGFNFPWVRPPFPGGTPLEGKFSNWAGFLFIHKYSYGGFFPGTSIGNLFPRGFIPILGGNPLRGMSSPGTNHAPKSDTIYRSTHSSGTPQ